MLLSVSPDAEPSTSRQTDLAVDHLQPMLLLQVLALERQLFRLVAHFPGTHTYLPPKRRLAPFLRLWCEGSRLIRLEQVVPCRVVKPVPILEPHGGLDAAMPPGLDVVLVVQLLVRHTELVGPLDEVVPPRIPLPTRISSCSCAEDRSVCKSIDSHDGLPEIPPGKVAAVLLLDGHSRSRPLFRSRARLAARGKPLVSTSRVAIRPVRS